MHCEPNSTKTWSMKEAAKEVGVGLPRLYARLREKGLFTLVGVDNRNAPNHDLIRDGFFIVTESSYWDKHNSVWRPCHKIEATYKGVILMQATADELVREKEQAKGKQPRVPSNTDNGSRTGSARSGISRAAAPRHETHEPTSDRPLRGAPPPNQSADDYFAGLKKMLTQEAANQ